MISLAVREEHRNLGIGKALMDRVMDIFENDLSIRLVRLEVREGNKRAISFYSHMGFKIQERIKGYYEDNEDAFVMIKKIR